MSPHHRQKRGRRRGSAHGPPELATALAGQPGQALPSSSTSLSFSAQQGHPFAPPPFRTGAHIRQESSFQTHAFPLPGMYPWPTHAMPATPVGPSPLAASASAAASAESLVPSQPLPQANLPFAKGTVLQRSPPTQVQESPTKRQRHRQFENGIGLGRPSRLSISVTASQAAVAARSATAPAVPVRQPFGPSNPSANGPVPFANGSRRTLTINPSTRATLGHFPHSSLSLPLPGAPATRHSARQSVSTIGGVSVGPRKHHSSQPSRSFERTSTIPHRVGPPPKAILGGPGGKTFEELRIPSASSVARSAPGDSAAPSGPVSPSSCPQPILKEPFEVKVGGATVRVALPPDEYDPPDTPSPKDPPEEARAGDTALGVMQDGKVGEKSSGLGSDPSSFSDTESKPTSGPGLEIEGSADSAICADDEMGETAVNIDKTARLPKVPRKEAYPWPERRAASPRSIPLPLSPLEEDLELSDVEDWVAHDTPYNSVDISSSWNGKAVRVTVPPVC